MMTTGVVERIRCAVVRVRCVTGVRTSAAGQLLVYFLTLLCEGRDLSGPFAREIYGVVPREVAVAAHEMTPVALEPDTASTVLPRTSGRIHHRADR